MKSAPTIAFDYRPSRWIGGALLLVTMAATLAPWLSGPPLWVRAALSLAAACFGGYVWLRHSIPRFRRIACDAAGWMLIDIEGRERAALLESHAHLGALLTMDLRHAPRAHFRPVFAPDNLDADTRRRLILMLARAEVAQTH
jgi:toxin CptA